MPCLAARAEETVRQGGRRGERLPGLREVDALVIEVMEAAEEINDCLTAAPAVGKYVENTLHCATVLFRPEWLGAEKRAS